MVVCAPVHARGTRHDDVGGTVVNGSTDVIVPCAARVHWGADPPQGGAPMQAFGPEAAAAAAEAAAAAAAEEAAAAGMLQLQQQGGSRGNCAAGAAAAPAAPVAAGAAGARGAGAGAAAPARARVRLLRSTSACIGSSSNNGHPDVCACVHAWLRGVGGFGALVRQQDSGWQEQGCIVAVRFAVAPLR
jgi:hypothetical protein